MAATESADGSGARKTTPPAGRSWMRTFLMITLTVVIPLCLYYFVYAAWSAAEMQRRNLRVLAATGRHIVDNSSRRARVLLWSVPHDKAHADLLGDEKALCSKIAERVKNSQLLEVDLDKCHRDASTSTDATPSVLVSLEDGPTGSLYVAELHGYGMRVRATAPLRDLIPFEDTSQGDFDAVVVRRLLPSQNGDAPTVGPVLVDNTDFSPDLIERVPSAPSAGTAPGAAPSAWSPPDFLQFRDHPRSKIAKEEYVTFAVPVKLVRKGERGDTSEPIILSVEGLVSPDRLRRQALALSPNALTYVICAVIAAVLTLPYLKIRFMARRERLRRLDLGLLAATAFGGTALATVLILHGAGRAALREWMDGRMASVAHSMQDAVAKEVALIKQQLDRSGGTLAQAGGCDPDQPKRNAEGKFLVNHPGALYPDFESIFCTDESGRQLSKWTPRATMSPLVPISDKGYFRRALMLSAADRTPDDAADALVFDSITAKTSGLRLAVFAKPLNGRREAMVGAEVPLPERTGVLVLSTQMRTLGDAVLPLPFQYVVVTQDESDGGRVLFPDGQRHQQFFAEARGDDRLRHLISSAGTAGSPPVDRNYLGRIYRMQAFALGSLPGATLVVFYDTAYLDAVSAETILSSGLCVLALVVSCLAAVLVATMLRAAALDAIWPTVQHWPIYLMGIALSVGFALAVSLVASLVSPTAKAFVLIAGPALGILAFLLVAPSVIGWFRKSQRYVALNQTAHRWLHPHLYLAFATVALLSLAALPTAIIVGDAHDAYVRALRDMIVQGHADDIQRRNGADLDRFVVLADDARVVPDTDIGERVFVRQADYQTLGSRIVPLAYYDDLTDKFSDGDRSGTEGYGPADRHVPSSCGFFGFNADEAMPQTYLAAWSAACLPAMTAFHDVLRDHLWRVDQRGQSGDHAVPFGWGVTACGALLVVVIFVFVRSIAQRILGLDSEDDGVHDRSAEVLDPARKRWLLLRPPRAVLAQIRRQPWGTTLDLAQTGCTAEQIAQAATQNGSVLLLHLEAQLHDVAYRNAVRQLIASASVPALSIVSAIDPLHYLTGRQLEQLGSDTAEDDAVKRMEEIDAWAQVLSTLDKGRFAKPPPAATGRVRGSDRRIVERLRQECEASDFLRDVERDLLARADFAHFDWEGIVEYVQDVAEPHYRAVWGLCSEEEKLTLIQLAQEGVISPRAFDVLRRLRRRRLVRCDPRFRIVNESFRRFVLEAESPEQVARWELPASASTWAMLRTPLLLLVIVVTGIIVITQQGVFNDTLGVAAAATGAVGAAATVVAQARKVFSGSSA